MRRKDLRLKQRTSGPPSEEIDIEERMVPKFVPGKELKDAVK
jgi:nucleoid DNA-binding protein